MTGALAASVKTPITSILLAVEMSGTLTHMLPVAAVAFIALLVSDLLRTKPIYGELLERYMRAQGGTTAIANRIDNGIMELPVEMGATAADGKLMRDVRWPSGCLMIGLRRGERQIVPRGDTRLRAGDYLVVLFSGEDEKATHGMRCGGCATCPSDAALLSSITIQTSGVTRRLHHSYPPNRTCSMFGCNARVDSVQG